ncbi:MAG: Cna B-type domain-containing protein [Lachnospiraceae bacterium]|nr:Cna B-type domain-containing protein [Lachnospiraceae bacterium]
MHNTKIVLTDELNGTDSYSVKLFDENYSECMGTFAVAGTDYTITEADKACFTSISDYDVILEEGVLKFGILPHEHTEETFSDKWPTTSGTVTTGAYYLAKDVTAESIICVEGDVKLCLNGYTLDMKDNYINLSSGATLTICDCSSEQTGKITGETTVIILNYGTFTLESGTLENTAESNGKVIFNEGTAIIMGGVIQVTGVEAYGINNWGNLKLSGGTIDVADDIGVFSSEGSTFELSGAPMITAGSCDLLIADNLNINITGELTGADTYTVECEGVIPRTFAVASEASILESSASKFVPVDEMQEVVSEDTTLVLDYQKMDIPVKVTSWEDDEDTELNRCVVAVNLYSDDGTFVKSVDLDEENQWTGSFADVYKYDADGEIEYTIELQYDGRYVATSQYSAEKGYEISMSLKHKHQLVYVNATSDGEVTTEITNVLQIICVNEEEKDNCQWTPETLQVSPPDYLESITYDGIAKSAISDCAFTTDATVSEIQYFVQSGSIWKSVAASEVVNAGTYKALVEVEDGEQTGVAQLIFEIEPAEMSVGVVAYSGEYDPFAGASAIEAVTVDIPAGIPDATVFYRIQEGDWEQNVPTIKGVGEMAVDVKVTAPNYKDYTTTVTAEMRPFDITYCEVVLEQDIYYYTGEAVKPKVVQLRTSAGVLPLTEDDLVISYENNIEISEEEPRVVKVAAVNTNYTGTASTCFMIAPYDGEVKMLYNGSETAEAWYNTDVAISAEGYTVSESITGPYTEQVVISEEGRELNKTLYFKQDGTGYITSEYPVVVNIDKTAPTFNGEGLGISIEDRFWNTLLNKITFGVFFNETKLVSISATDAFSGVESYYYYVDTTGNETVLSSGELDALDAVGRFAKSVSGQFEMADENKYVVYAYAVDMVGNKSAYICSDGVVMDTTAPVIKVTEPTEAAGTLKDTSATFVVEADEEVMIGVWIITDYSGEALEVKISADYDYWEGLEADKQIIKINDGQVCISYKTTAVANQTKEITITGLKPNTFYEYSVEVYDLAENENIFAGEEDSTVPGWYYMRPITTLKTMPVFDEEPVISGTYGQQLADMTLSQPVSTNGVAGSWNISSEDVTDMPQVTGNKTYTVTFTPEDEDNYAVITKQVIPTVAKKQVTITIDNQTVKYKEEIPGFTYTASGLVETEDTTVLNVDLSTTAVKGSSAGQYPIVGTYSSDNYTVSFNKATLTIEQAEGKLTIEAGKEAYAKTFGEEAFTLTGIQVVSDGTVVYTVADSQNAAGEAVAADKVITVDKEGRVTIQGTGTAKVVISVPETTNYTKAEASISVVVGKAAQENAVLTKNYVYNKDTADSVDLGACVPEDAGKVSYVVKSVAGTFTEAPVIKDEKLTYVISKGEKDATGKVVVEVSSENYETFTITVDMCLKYETKVVLKSGSEVTAKGSLTYGDTLAELSFGEAVFVEEGTDTVVVGTLSWAEPDSVPKVADTEAAWIFTPDSADYAVVSGKTAIVVNKAKQPELSIVPVGDAVYGQEGSICFEVTGGMDGTEITVTVPKDNGVVTEVNTNSASKFYAVPLNAGKVTVTAVSVEKSGNYEDATATYELTVAPVAMEADWLSWAGEFAGEDTYIGEALTPQVKAYFIADGILTKGKDYTVTYVNNTNAYTLTEADADFDATKAPAVVVTGKGNFAGTVKKYFVINKAQNAPNMPANTMTVENATDTVGKVSLPEGWVWQDAKQALAEGNTTLVIVVYDGADKGNYVNETVEVIITRLEAATPAPGGDNGSSTPTATPAPGGNSGSSTPTVTQAPVITTAPAEVITAPKTDDASMSEGWLVLMAMACVVVGMGSGMYYRRKREQ